MKNNTYQFRDKREILDDVLPEYPKISKAPRSLFDFPEVEEIKGDPKALDAFEDRKRAEEAGKKYKAVDERGNVYLVPNPWGYEPREPGRKPVPRPEPEKVYTYREALAAARGEDLNEFRGRKEAGNF